MEQDRFRLLSDLIGGKFKDQVTGNREPLFYLNLPILFLFF
jgi:hypothetical protein